MIPTEQENLNNIKRCPQYDGCSIPRCPLDYWADERTELPEDEVCPLKGKYRSKRTKGRMGRLMEGMKSFIWEKK